MSVPGNNPIYETSQEPAIPDDDRVRCLGLGVHMFAVIDMQQLTERVIYFENATTTQLRPIHFALFVALARHPGEELDKSALIQEAGLSGTNMGPRLINELNRLRRKLGTTTEGVSRRDIIETIIDDQGSGGGRTTRAIKGVLADFPYPDINWIERVKARNLSMP